MAGEYRRGTRWGSRPGWATGGGPIGKASREAEVAAIRPAIRRRVSSPSALNNRPAILDSYTDWPRPRGGCPRLEVSDMSSGSNPVVVRRSVSRYELEGQLCLSLSCVVPLTPEPVAPGQRAYKLGAYERWRRRVASRRLRADNAGRQYNTRVRAAREGRKRELVAYRGGCCARCRWAPCSAPEYAGLDFHHRDPATKRFGLAANMTRTMAALVREVEQCDLLCARCHVLHELGVRRRDGPPATPAERQRAMRRARLAVLVERRGGECVSCRWAPATRAEYGALDFHHRDPKAKRFAVGGRHAAYRWEVVVAEADKCDLLCRRCHRIHHAVHGITRSRYAGPARLAS